MIGKRGLAEFVWNGWEFTAIAEWHTGLPFTIFSGYDNSFSAIGADRAVQIHPNAPSAREDHTAA